MSFAEYPFHVSRWPRSVIHPHEYDGGEFLSLSWDLGSVVDEAEKKRVIKAWIGALPGLRNLRGLRVWSHVTQPLFDALCQLDQLEVLQLKWSNVRDLGRITALQRLRALSIGSSTRVQSIEPLADLLSLELLEIENFKLITDFSPLTRLVNLASLAVTGSMWSRQAVGSLEPFAAMTWLTSLALDTSSVSSIQALGALKGLRHLDLGGRLPYEEYARLSAQLPDTECRWFAPYLELAESGFSPCKRCGQPSMLMLTGKGKPILCRHCDAAKLDKHVRQFNLARSAG